METIEYLIQFGLTRQEATVYMLLFQEGPLNGYEVSKLTGISRSNAYSALAGLVDKGAAYMMEEQAVKYIPVPVEEFCKNKLRCLDRAAKKLQDSMPDRRVHNEGYITIRGEQHILDKLNHMLLDTKERVYLSVARERLTTLINELNILREKGIKIVIITNPPYELEGATVYHAQKPLEQIRMIVDSQYVLTGTITDENNATCLYSSNNNLVEIFKEALRNEIQLIDITKGNQTHD